MKKINWLDHLINLVVVVVGISIAYTLNNWNDSKRIKELQDVYIESMMNDIEVDITRLDSIIDFDQESLILIRRLLEGNKKPLAKDSAEYIISKIASLNSFSSRNITFESVKSSGKFELLNLKLRLDIMEFYHSGYSQIEEIESYYKMNFDNQIIPFLINEAFSGNNGLNESVLLSDKFRTVLGLHSSLLIQKIEAYKNGHRLAEKLRQELELNK